MFEAFVLPVYCIFSEGPVDIFSLVMTQPNKAPICPIILIVKHHLRSITPLQMPNQGFRDHLYLLIEGTDGSDPVRK